MSEEQALLAAIRDHPGDDDCRLVYADWLEEHGDGEKAEFIRVQVELARRTWADEGYLDEEGERLQRREHALLRRQKKRWLAGLPSLKGVSWQFHRGLPGSDWAQVRRRAEALELSAAAEQQVYQGLLPGLTGRPRRPGSGKPRSSTGWRSWPVGCRRRRGRPPGRWVIYRRKKGTR